MQELCQYPTVLMSLGLALSEKQIPQVGEGLLEVLEPGVGRPRQRTLSLTMRALSSADELNTEHQFQQIRYVAGPCYEPAPARYDEQILAARLKQQTNSLCQKCARIRYFSISWT